MTRVKLSYFDFEGRGEACRLALAIAGVEFEDERVARADWPARKPTTPFGAMPVLAIEGEGVLAQSNAILGLIGSRHGLLPADDFQAARHRALLEAVEDLDGRIARTIGLADDAEVKRRREELMAGYMKQWGQHVSREIEGPFVGGDALSVADLKIFASMGRIKRGVLDHVPPGYFADFPKLEALYAAVAAHPGVAAWYASRR